MQRFTCNICDTHSAYGYIFDSRDLAVCRDCRDHALTFMATRGIEMTEANPFIAELCLFSHEVESAWFEYYNYSTGTQGLITRMTQTWDREGLVKRKRPLSYPIYTRAMAHES